MTTTEVTQRHTAHVRAAAVALSGALAGLLMAGPGGRLAMRLSAQIDRSAHGRITENGAVVGEFTLAGTIGFVVFVGIAGALIAAALWSLVSPWLPARAGRRRLAAFVVGMALGGRFAIDGDNIDFRILDPAIVHAAIFVVLGGLTGLVAAVVEPRVVRGFEGRGGGARTLSWFVLGAGALLSIPFSMLFFSRESCGCAEPPWIVGLAVAGLVVAWLFRLGFGVRRRPDPGWLVVGGRGLVVVATIAGFAHLAAEIGHFV